MSRAIDTEHFRKALLEERERVLGAISYVREENPRNADVDALEMPIDEHLAESASVTLDEEIDDTLEANSEHVLTEIDAALARIEGGTFGTCQNCGREISVERLEALPYATLCIDCKRNEERG
jgi:DnaK suppressor protein